MIWRIAAKHHECESARFARQIGEPVPCDTTIRPGQRYAECPEFGTPFHPARYHEACYRAEFEEETTDGKDVAASH